MLWNEEYARNVPLVERSAEIGEIFRLRGNRYRPYDLLHVASGDFRCDIYDARRAAGEWRLQQAVGGFRPNYPTIPWHPDWTGAPGGDGLAIVEDPDTGHRWSVGRTVWYSPHRSQRILIAVDAGAVVVPVYNAAKKRIDDAKGPDGLPILADTRVDAWNQPKIGGAGVGLQPLRQAWLDAEDIPVQMSLYGASDAFSPQSLVWSPASKLENSGKPNVGGVHISLEYDGAGLQSLRRRLTGVELRDFDTITRALSLDRGRGAGFHATGPRFSIVAERVAVREDLLAGLLAVSRVHVHQPPWSTIAGLPPTREPRRGWITREL